MPNNSRKKSNDDILSLKQNMLEILEQMLEKSNTENKRSIEEEAKEEKWYKKLFSDVRSAVIITFIISMLTSFVINNITRSIDETGQTIKTMKVLHKLYVQINTMEQFIEDFRKNELKNIKFDNQVGRISSSEMWRRIEDFNSLIEKFKKNLDEQKKKIIGDKQNENK